MQTRFCFFATIFDKLSRTMSIIAAFCKNVAENWPKPEFLFAPQEASAYAVLFTGAMENSLN
jgi:hypothetical protein